MIEIVKILQREDVKVEIKKLCVPFLEIVLGVINPYIYITLTLIFMSFIMNLAIVIIILRNKHLLSQLKL
jgi:hypothetical protein